MHDPDLADRLRRRVREIPDFPQPGIDFKDITPVLADAPLFGDVLDSLARHFSASNVQMVAGIESRGFIFAAPLALRLQCGFVPVRKPGKLPFRTERVEYDLEYGTDALEAHIDAVVTGDRVLIVDDVLATGGTAAGAVRLMASLGAHVVGAAFILELGFLNGRARLADLDVHALLTY